MSTSPGRCVPCIVNTSRVTVLRLGLISMWMPYPGSLAKTYLSKGKATGKTSRILPLTINCIINWTWNNNNSKTLRYIGLVQFYLILSDQFYQVGKNVSCQPWYHHTSWQTSVLQEISQSAIRAGFTTDFIYYVPAAVWTNTVPILAKRFKKY